MPAMTPEEVLAQLRVGQAGTPEEQAAALAVLASAIAESQKLGKMVVSQGSSRWSKSQLRTDPMQNENKELRRPLR